MNPRALLEEWRICDTPRGYVLVGVAYCHPDHTYTDEGVRIREILWHLNLDETTAETAECHYQLGDRA